MLFTSCENFFPSIIVPKHNCFAGELNVSYTFLAVFIWLEYRLAWYPISTLLHFSYNSEPIANHQIFRVVFIARLLREHLRNESADECGLRAQRQIQLQIIVKLELADLKQANVGLLK